MEDSRKIFLKLPKRIQRIVTAHMWYNVGVEDQTIGDYMKNADAYVCNFLLDVNDIRRHCPQSYSEKKIKETHEELMNHYFQE